MGQGSTHTAHGSETFDAWSSYYKYRTPYSPAFFAELSKRLNCGPKSNVLDIACGTGDLAIGIKPFVGSVTAVDFSPSMLARAQQMEGVRYVLHNFNKAPIIGVFDHFLIGRAVQWLDPQMMKKAASNALTRGGKIAICHSDFSPRMAWQPGFKRLRRQYTRDQLASQLQGKRLATIAAAELLSVDQFTSIDTYFIPLEALLGNTLSYVDDPATILSRKDDFMRDVAALVSPYMRDNKLPIEVVSTASIKISPG